MDEGLRKILPLSSRGMTRTVSGSPRRYATQTLVSRISGVQSSPKDVRGRLWGQEKNESDQLLIAVTTTKGDQACLEART